MTQTPTKTTALAGFNDLLAGEAVSQALPGYIERESQIEMAALVAEALIEGTHAVVEAGTGTGKSLAYLLPIVRSGKRAIISTSNKALQAQIIGKDIPFIQQYVVGFESALLKGMSNYLCLDRLAKYGSELQDEQSRADLNAFTEQMSDTWNGDLESSDAPPVTDALREHVHVDRYKCAGDKCAYHGECYFYMAKAKAAAAQVVVANHDLLMLDLLLGGKVLPEHDVTVVDEAHHLEEKATDAFTVAVSNSAMARFLALTELRKHLDPKTEKDVQSQVEVVWSRLAQMTDARPGKRVVLTQPIEEGLRLASLVGDVAKHLHSCSPSETTEKGQKLHEKLIKRAENLSDDLRTVFSVKDTTKYVYYLDAEQKGRKRILEAKAAPLDVSPFLRSRLFGKPDKVQVICTSATIAAPDLSYFKSRVGMDPILSTQDLVLPLVFDFQHNALLYLPRRVPEPPTYGASLDEKQEYQYAIAVEMLKLARASRGRAFLLFTSKEALTATYTEIAETLRSEGCIPLKQGEMSTASLVQQFRETPGSVLFGLKSFWEGVDIVGDALSLVVIDKLPFAPPDDPIYAARAKLLEQAGEKPFFTYSIPQAIIQLKQGLGRLIRTAEDRGVMAILDSRLHSKGYGKQILRALPPAQVTISLQDVQQFF